MAGSGCWRGCGRTASDAMSGAASDQDIEAHWRSFAAQYGLLGSPLCPCAEDIRIIEEMLAAEPEVFGAAANPRGPGGKSEDFVCEMKVGAGGTAPGSGTDIIRQMSSPMHSSTSCGARGTR